MDSPPNILTLVIIVGWLAFALGCALTRRAYRREIEYYQDVAEKWWERCRELETGADAEWWQKN